MNISKLITSLRSRLQSPRVYAMVLTNGFHQVLELMAAYDYDEAFSKSVDKLRKQLPSESQEWKVFLWSKFEVKELISAITELSTCEEQIAPETGNVSKNDLMRFIVENKDRALFEARRGEFSVNEQQYLIERLGS